MSDEDIINKIDNWIADEVTPREIALQLKIPTRELLEVLVHCDSGKSRQGHDLYCILSKTYEGSADWLARFADRSSAFLREKFPKINDGAIFQPESDIEEIMLLLHYRKRRFDVVEMFGYLSELENALHREVKRCSTKYELRELRLVDARRAGKS